MAIDEKFLQLVVAQLGELPDFKAKKMFGGVGFFKDDAMFGVIQHGHLMLRAAPTDRGTYAAQPQFTVEMRGELKTMPYYAVPEEVFRNPRLLAQWAEQATSLAREAKKLKKWIPRFQSIWGMSNTSHCEKLNFSSPMKTYPSTFGLHVTRNDSFAIEIPLVSSNGRNQ